MIKGQYKINISIFYYKFTYGAIAQLARALAWHARGLGFESP